MGASSSSSSNCIGEETKCPVRDFLGRVETLEGVSLARSNSLDFSREELQDLYRVFIRDFPDGKIPRERFYKDWAELFHQLKDPVRLAQHLFRTFDRNGDGMLDFREYARALSLTERGGLNRQQSWLFSLFDVDGDGVITEDELCDVARSLSTKTECGHVTLLPRPYKPTWCRRRPTVDRASAVFGELDVDGNNKVTKAEFFSALQTDPYLMREL